MKICKTCSIEKDQSEFDGGRNHCKKCNKKKYSERVKNGEYDDCVDKKCSNCGEVKQSIEFRTHRTYCKKCGDKKTYESRKDVQYENNKEYLKKYHIDKKDEINSRLRSYKKYRKSNDSLFRLSLSIGNTIRNGIKFCGYKKSMKCVDIIGTSMEELKLYLESKFEPWMSWENYGKYNGELNYGWDIDHIIPVSSAKNEKELMDLNHFTNLQPLCSFTNRYIKRDLIV